MVSVAFAAFEPDRSRFNGGALPNIINAIPTSDGWGPLKDGLTIDTYYVLVGDNALNALLDQSGNNIATGLVIGNVLTDESSVILNDEAGNTLIDSVASSAVTGSAFLPSACLGVFAGRKEDGTERIFAGTVTKLYEFNKNTYTWNDVSRTSGGSYAATNRWSFEKFGQFVYAANGVDAEQKIDLELDTNFSNNTSAPVAKYIKAVGDFMFRGNVQNFPYQVQWSAINNPQSNTATVDFSDYQDMPVGDEVMGIVPLTSGAHVWMRSALHNMSFALQSEFVFTRQTVTEMRGTSAPYSIASIAQDDYVVYCDDGFWRYNVGQFQPIGSQRVNQWFLTECDQDERGNIIAMPDPENQIVWFSYTASSGTRRMLGYHYILDRWCLANVSLQASMRARTFAYSGISGAGLTTDLLRFAAINANGQLTYLVGDNLAATVETNDLASDTGFFINRGVLQGDPQTFTVTQETANYRGGTFAAKSPVSPSSRTKTLSLRGNGKVHKFTVSIPAAETWTTVSALEIDGVPSAKS